MKDYWLAKLISSVTEVDSRKRLQKSIYLLQRADCPLQFSYILHYYGPYSFELSGLIDQLKGADIIDESSEATGFGNIRYRSKISQKGKPVLENFQRSKTGRRVYEQIKPFISRFKDLNQENLWVLELGATVAYFYEGNWEGAQTRAAEFKRIRKNDSNLSKAIELAKRFLPTG
ncbi:MAG: hypothetical protein MUO97_09265 [Dehalococcoidia bacterium]|nr:hypothetical protein [Dehalococcoidia bacterium]